MATIGNILSTNQVSLTADVSGILPVTQGGVGISSYAVGDILYADTTTSLTKLVVGTNGQSLIVSGGIPAWASPSAPILSTTTGIDTKTIATTNLYTVPVGKTAIITGAIVRVTSATAITVGASVSIGGNGGGNDIYTDTVLTNILTTSDIWGFITLGKIASQPAANVVKLSINTAATGTSQTISVDLMGYIL